MTLTVGSLFSGIGGLDLGLERAGMEVIWQSEIDPYACRILKKHWPKVTNLGNIKEIKWTDIVRPDVICGGYPCQPFSTAGRRQGENDPRHLWPWVRQAISDLRPRYAILENVRGHLSMGGLSVIGDLTDIGYSVEWRIVSAASVGANHRRDRIFLLAYPNDAGLHTTQLDTTKTGEPALGFIGGRGDKVANTYGERLERQRPQLETTGLARGCQNEGQPLADPNDRRYIHPTEPQKSNFGGRSENAADDGRGTTNNSRVHNNSGNFNNFGQFEIFGQLDGGRPNFTNWWQIEPDVGRVANGVPSRVDRLRGLGNAVVPQVAETVGRLIMAHAEQNK